MVGEREMCTINCSLVLTTIVSHQTSLTCIQAYAQVTNRSAKGGKWIIPWAEDDPHLGASQFWVSRTLAHMDAAKEMGVDGALLITWRMEAVAPTIWALAHKAWNASLTVADAWCSWAAGEFEIVDQAVAAQVGAAFAALEGAEQAFKTAGCPGFAVQCSPPAVAAAYKSKVLALMKLAPSVLNRAAAGKLAKRAPTASATLAAPLAAPAAAEVSPAAQARWHRWISFLRYVSATTEAGCPATLYPAAAARVRAMATAAARKAAAETMLVPLRASMVAAAENLTTMLAEAVAGPGEMGMLSTLHDIEFLNTGTTSTDLSYGENLLNASATAELAGWLGGGGGSVGTLPSSCVPSKKYSGEPKLVARAARSSVDADERVPVSVVVLAPNPPAAVELFYRKIQPANRGGSGNGVSAGSGAGAWKSSSMVRAGNVGAVYSGWFDTENEDSEYYLTVLVGSKTLVWPPGAPDSLTQTVVVVL